MVPTLESASYVSLGVGSSSSGAQNAREKTARIIGRSISTEMIDDDRSKGH
jgi:hypothetical protein